MGEVENIAPGLSRELHVELPAGTYETACKPGMIGKGIRAALTVSGSAAPLTDDAALADATASYSRYVKSQTGALLTKTAGVRRPRSRPATSTKAKALFPIARTYWERIEPVAEIFGDLDPKIDGREEVTEEGMEFTGFHRIEKDLWATGDVSKDGPIADQLLTDVKEIVAKANAEKLSPLQLANGAKDLLDEVATGKITGEEDRYSHTDLWDFNANVEGSKAAIAALRPVLEERDAGAGQDARHRVRQRRHRARQAPRRRRLEAAQRADPGRPEGAVGRDQRARRADQQGRRGRREVSQVRAVPRPDLGVGMSETPRRAIALAGVGVAGVAGAAGAGGAWCRRRLRRPEPDRTSPPVPSRSPARTRPASSRPPRTGCTSSRSTSSPRTATRLVDLLKDWTAAAARMTAGRDAGEIGAVNGMPEAPPDDTGEALGLPPSGLTLTIGFGPTLFRDAAGKDRFGIAATAPAGPRRPAALPGRRARRRDLRRRPLRPGLRQRPAGRRARHPQPGPDRHGRGQRPLVAARLRAYVLDVARRRRPRATCSASRTAPPTSRPRRPTCSREHLWVQAGRRSGVDGRRLVPGHPQDPDADRDLGPLLAGRAGDDHRPAQGHRRAAGPGARSSTRSTSPPRAPTANRCRRDLPRPARPPGRQRRGPAAAPRATTSSTAPTGSAGSNAGLFFIAYQRDPRTAFVPVQRNLARHDEMNEYLRHVSSGLFACPPGVSDAGRLLGQHACSV